VVVVPRLGRVFYALLALAGIACFIGGVALIFPPAALALTGIVLGGLGLIGLGMQVTR
jgi:hypothetical protein